MWKTQIMAQRENKRKWKDWQILGLCKRSIKKQRYWESREAVVPIVVGPIGTYPKAWEKGLMN